MMGFISFSWIANTLFLFIFLYYGYHLYLFYRALKLEQKDLNTWSLLPDAQSVSIIVCVRDGKEKISSLLDSILLQNIDLSRIEIIIANDGSSDGTEILLQEYSITYKNIKYFNVLNRELAKSPKKNAITQAIAQASNEIILLTDADCIVKPNWIRSHLAMYSIDSSTEMVVGFSQTHLVPNINNKLVQLFEHIDFKVLMLTAQGAIQAGIPFSCSGQNISYKKQSFDSVAGFSELDSYLSGDDILLMQKFHRAGKRIRFAAFACEFVETLPICNWFYLFNQRSRWASNLKVMFRMNKRFFLFLVASFLLFVVLPLINVYIYIFKLIADILFIHNGLNYSLGKNENNNNSGEKKYVFLSYLLWYIITPLYMIIVFILGMFSIYRWGGRKGRSSL